MDALYREAGMRELDRRAIADLGGDSFELMRRAGETAFRVLRAQWPEARRIAVCCGRGNNGGDGYVLARLAREAGMPVVVFACEPGGGGSPDARRARAEYLAAGGSEQRWTGSEALAEHQLIVDAVFGIGLSRPPAEPEAAWIEAINASGRPVLALDLPSGLATDTGSAPGACVQATVTTTFIGWKIGLFTGVGPLVAGRRVLEPLGVSDAIRGAVPAAALLLEPAALGRWLPPRAPLAHKGDHGHVLVVGGDHGYGGAASLATQAALRGGAGLVSVATRAEHVASILCARPEAMARAIGDGAGLEPLLRRADVVAVGPGLGQSDWSRELLDAALRSGRKLVLDADALNLIATRPGALPNESLITPHPGEAARLLGCGTARVQADRPAAAQELAARYAAVAVLKGAGTVIAAPDGRLAVCAIAEPALASGGTGDVLTGVAAALRAQGLDAFDAACAAVLAHAEAGRRVARGGARGALAGDVIEGLRAVLNP
jgi:NAD(P)H-hydrate epimerase